MIRSILVPVDGGGDGDPASCIAEHVQANAVELIVMGRRGRGDLGGLPLGSVPHKVAQVAPFACMMVE
jgi:nucleotide-binding universal stress UspA family protein